MKKLRLLKLADYLDTVQPKKFNLDDWQCGTVACACGHACSIPSFRHAGLKLLQEKILENGKVKLVGSPVFDGQQDWKAIERFFDLSENHALYLFDGYKYGGRRGPKTVAKRIRAYVASKGATADEYYSSRSNFVTDYYN